MSPSPAPSEASFRVAHLTTVDLSLRFLVFPQLLAVRDAGGEAVGISAPGPWVGELESAGIRHIPLTASTRGMSLTNDLRAAVQLWRVLRRERLTVLHTHNPKPGIYGRVLGRLAGVPLVVNTLHGMYASDEDRFLKRAIVYSLEAVAARFSDAELHQNIEDLELSKRRGILPRGKGDLLGNGVNLTRFDPGGVDPAARADLRKEWGVEDDQVVVGMVGRLVVEKGYPELFAAAAGMDERYVFVVVGPEDPEKSDAVPPAVIETARARGVRFLGMRTDVEEIFSAFDLMVLPSHREGFPRAAMEAAAMGLPIVATNIRGCRQVVEQGVNGLLVPVDDPRALREAIETLGEDADLRASMGRASRAKALGEFDEDRVVEIVMDTYRRGLMRKGLGHLLPAAMLETTSIGEPRRAGERDVASIASLHSSGINTGFLPKLGPRFMRVLYRAMAGWPGAVVLVIDDEGGPVAFVAGVTDTGAFYKHFLRHFGLRAILAAFPRILRPSVLRSAWESFRYGEEDHREVPAELISMAVAPRARRSGLSLRLGAELQRSLSALGTTEIKVVVGSDNQPAIAAYQRMGFVFDHRIEVHAGQDSDVLVWRA
ncbi:MAG TPA: GNAT family N-acetyltransferase [Acidimicrobiia bacterium]|jgi:glycosyltransferase involved in cell wall biosynthesis/GNAT superfamily N-acetyltransferase|nr:GNAT family N-acetyltransferase [Acidimicrobiia bacterium]